MKNLITKSTDDISILISEKTTRPYIATWVYNTLVFINWCVTSSDANLRTLPRPSHTSVAFSLWRFIAAVRTLL